MQFLWIANAGNIFTAQLNFYVDDNMSVCVYLDIFQVS